MADSDDENEVPLAPKLQPTRKEPTDMAPCALPPSMKDPIVRLKSEAKNDVADEPWPDTDKRMKLLFVMPDGPDDSPFKKRMRNAIYADLVEKHPV